MTANRDLLVNYCEFPEPEPVAAGDDRSVNAYGDGQVDITTILGNRERPTEINSDKGPLCSKVNRLLVPSMGKVVQFGHTLCWIKNSGGQAVACGRLVVNMYRLDCNVDKPGNQASVANETGAKLDLWHQRMAHLNVSQIKPWL